MRQRDVGCTHVAPGRAVGMAAQAAPRAPEGLFYRSGGAAAATLPGALHAHMRPPPRGRSDGLWCCTGNRMHAHRQSGDGGRAGRRAPSGWGAQHDATYARSDASVNDENPGRRRRPASASAADGQCRRRDRAALASFPPATAFCSTCTGSPRVRAPT